jgi:hypothetical protein
LSATLGALLLTARRWLCALAGLPWLAIGLAVTTSGAHLLAALAWNVLTANLMAFALPIFTLLIPLLVERCVCTELLLL